MEYQLAPSILAADFKVLGQEIISCAKNGARYLHFDVMDGIFVPSISFGMPVLSSIQGLTDQVMDVHLMITEPIRYVEAFQRAGARILTVHYEACRDLSATLQEIHSAGMKAGISIKPGTEVEVLRPYLEKAEMFLVMSVEPGFGGQAFLPDSPGRIQTLKKMLTGCGVQADIEVDGGIYHSNVREVLNAGANIIVAGSAVFKGNIEKNVRGFMDILKEYE